MTDPKPITSATDRVQAFWEMQQAKGNTFKALGEGCYRFYVPHLRAALEVDYLRRDGGQLKGEILVRCEMSGARAIDGVLTVTDLNLSSTRTRSAFAKDLVGLSRFKDGEEEWRAVVEEFALRILSAERNGTPAVLLADVLPPTAERLLYVDGLPLLKDHPMILFGDGGTGKSLLALHFAGRLALKGHKVGLFDWELDAGEHRLRLGQLFPNPLPRIIYARCSHPLCREVERLRRIVKDADLEYIIMDSIGFACDGPPEAAEQAMRYFQALRTLGRLGSLHIAHVKSGFEGADLRPFGSIYWHNGARSTWNVKLASPDSDQPGLQLALHHRKSNTTGRMRSVGFEMRFHADSINVEQLDLREVPELASQLPIAERVRAALKSGIRTRKELLEDLDGVKDASLSRILRREKQAGRVLEFPGDKFGLTEKLL